MKKRVAKVIRKIVGLAEDQMCLKWINPRLIMLNSLK